MLAGLCGGAADTLAWQCYQPITTQIVAGSAHDAVCKPGVADRYAARGGVAGLSCEGLCPLASSPP